MEPFSEGEVYLPLEGVLDVDREIARLKQDREKLEKQMQGVEKKLSSEGFLANAPAEVVEKEREKLREFKEKSEALSSALKRFQS